MSTRTRKQLSVALLLFAGLFFALLITHYSLRITPAHALEVGVSEVDETIALSSTDIRVVIARIIRVALGLLGIIAVGLVIYGGFLWMTAAGDEDKVAQAKRVLTNAVIGLVIILTSFAITQFVLSRLVAATTGSSSRTTVGVDDGGGGGFSGRFRITSMRPVDPGPDFEGFCRNTTVYIQMSDRVDAATVPSNLEIRDRAVPDASPVPIAPTVSGKQIAVRSATPCAELPDERCFEPGKTYRFNFASGLHPAGSTRSLDCAASGSWCDAVITIQDCLDVTPPAVGIMVPDPGQSVPPDWVTIRGSASDDQAVGAVEFFDGSTSLGFGDLTPVEVLTPVEATYDWSTAELLDAPGEAPGTRSCRILGATAFDVNEHHTAATPVPVVVRPAHCFNGVQDETETGSDCGGDPAVAGYCGRCAGELCTSGEFCSNACRSGSCIQGTCVDLPRIDDFTRVAGPGSFITIDGAFFDTGGSVTFLGQPGPEDDRPALPAPCDGAWTPEQIIVVVPEGAPEGPLAVKTDFGTDTTDNETGIVDTFSPTGPTLPGLCPVVPDEGGVGTRVMLRGNGFGATQLDSTVTVGGVEARVVHEWGIGEIRTQVPAVSTGPRAVTVTVSGESSNAVMFQVLGPEAGTTPVVSAVSPATGPTGTYVTLFGSNFGEVGQVVFRNPATGATAIGDVDFPEQCAGVFWQQNEITVKVPETYSSGVASDESTAIEQTRHELTVRRSGASEAVSNVVNFTVTDGTPAPGLCGILPVSGPANTLVRFFGEGFGTLATTTARFFNQADALPTLVEREEVRAQVPGTAQTGPVVVTVTTAPEPSNPRNFEVADCRAQGATCSTGFECCSNGSCMPDGSCSESVSDGGYAWYISTGPVPRVPRLVFACGESVVPSPAPYSVRAGGEDVCVNALVTGRFSIPMDPGTINLGSVLLVKCVGDGEDVSCTGNEETATVEAFPWSDGVRSGHGFRLTPGALLPDTWYEVRLLTAIQGDETSGSISLEADPDCGPGVAYCWQFKTREDTELCALDSISLEPLDHVARASGDVERVLYTAFGRTDEDICLSIDTTPYDFAWTASAPDGYATIVPGVPEGIPGFEVYDDDDRAVASPVLETPAGNPVDVRAAASADGSALADGVAFLTIDYTDPEVVEYAPNCSEACINAKLVLRFNTDMSEALLAHSVLNPSAVELWQCANESCIFPATRIDLVDHRLNAVTDRGIPPGHILEIAPETTLLPTTYYRVVLDGAVQSRSGVSLVGENYGPDFSWIFRTKSDSTPCAISSVELDPSAATVTVVGSRVPFSASAHGAPDSCSADGQELVSTDDWSWSTVDPNVANYLVAGIVVDTTSELGPSCSSACLLTGATGVFGEVAVCGNGNTCTASVECETGEVCSRGQCIESVLGEECDDGNTNDQDGCSRICLHEGSAAGVCGNGTVDQYEDCDGGDGCSSACLHEGALASTLGGTTCGNSVIDLGEDCDDGNRTSRDGCSSQCLAEGSAPGPLAICGNGDVETGEACDGGVGCDRTTCLHLGTSACQPPFPSTDTGVCCGNGEAPQAGEDCDDGNLENGDGCSARCLLEGASAFYAVPSFCGDGDYGVGEACESDGGDGMIDPLQVAEAIGRGTVSNGEQSTTLTAGTSTFTDTSSFTLQCGFTSDTQCRNPYTGSPNPSGYGVGTDSCCYVRPWIAIPAPLPGATDVCRNPLIRVQFNQKMDLGSFTGHVLVARETAAATCLAGEEEMTRMLPPPPAGVPLARIANPLARLGSWLGTLWNPLVGFAAPLITAPPAIPWLQPAGSGAWCLGSVTGRVSGVHHENNPATPVDDRSSLLFALENGALDPSTWYRVRVIGEVAVGDDLVHGVRSSNGVGMPANYEFSFRTGTEICTVHEVVVTDESAAELFTRTGEEHPFGAVAASYRLGGYDPIVPVPGVYDWAWGTWSSANSTVVGVADPAASSVNPNTATVRAAGKNGTTTVAASLAITADTLSPESTVGRTVLGTKQVEAFICEHLGLEVADVPGNTLGLLPPYGSFRTRYCRDAGAPGLTEDLPMMEVQTVPQPPGVAFKEFLLRYENSVVDGNDAIGFRALSNPNHFSAARWFAAQGFAGTPQAITVDGYDAVRDDRNVYVHAANLNTDDGSLYDNIYVLSVNEGARPTTMSIFEQLAENLVFNQNLMAMNTKLCTPTAPGVPPTSCSSDFDCVAPATCAAPIDKIRRDTRRLADLRDMEAVLGRGCSGTKCLYPTLASGTFVRSVANSTWPSWLDTLSRETGALLPADPLNRFAACPTGYDAATCFAAAPAAGCTDGSCYQCPLGSHVYEYTSRAPDEYQVAVDLEYTGHWWATTIAAFDASPGATLIAGQGLRHCRGSVVGNSNVCGDGVVNPVTEACERGETGVRACIASGAAGRIAALCNDTCTDLVAVSGATCVAEFCGDGVIQSGEVCDDGANNGFYGFCDTACTGPSAYCGDGSLAGIEQCDLGTTNGQWNRTSGTLGSPLSCAWDCTFPGPYCGDGEVNGTEACDSQGVRNPGRCSVSPLPCTTASDCPASESCTLCTATTRCSSKVTLSCSSVGASCDSGRGVCTTYPSERVRACTMTGGSACSWGALSTCQVIGTGCGDGVVRGTEQCEDSNSDNTDSCTNMCRWNVCGDGIRFEGVEQCDAGTANGTPCAAPYGGTCNYCSPTCTYVTQTGGFCGDGTISGDELCDYSASPMVRSPAPTGYDAALSRCNLAPLLGFAACHALCPPTYDQSSVRFQDDSVSAATAHTFEASGEVAEVSIPACRLGNGLVLNTVSFGTGVFYFPSPMDMLLILDNSPSMNATELKNIRKALCGQAQPNCDTLDADGAIKRLFESRDPGEVRLGIIEFGDESRYRTWDSGTHASATTSYAGGSCSPTDAVPCYERSQYFGRDNIRGTADDAAPANADVTGLLSATDAHEEALRTVIASLDGANRGTRSYLALRQARAILDASDARSKVIIYLSDGAFAKDCCAYITPGSTQPCTTSSERSHCADPAGPVACAVATGSFECAASDPEAAEMSVLGDGITVFTVSVSSSATVSALMERWADHDPSGTITFSYAGTNVTQMFDNILSNIGVRLQIANNEAFSDTGVFNWMDEITIPEPNFLISFPTPELNNACTDAWQAVHMRTLYASTGADATVTLAEPRWNYCPR